MLNILSIGNSYSQDAQRYLYGIARAEGVPALCVNLYIGGCPLETHYHNLIADARTYALEINGTSGAGFNTSIREALAAQPWDVVTFQQASPLSFLPETYRPYLSELIGAARAACPGARILMHETWGYLDGSDRLAKTGFASMREMTAAVTACYRKMEAEVGTDGYIPCGENLLALYEHLARPVHRDPIHADLGAARYLLGATFYRAITGQPVTAAFDDFDIPVSPEDARIAREIANRG